LGLFTLFNVENIFPSNGLYSIEATPCLVTALFCLPSLLTLSFLSFHFSGVQGFSYPNPTFAQRPILTPSYSIPKTLFSPHLFLFFDHTCWCSVFFQGLVAAYFPYLILLPFPFFWIRSPAPRGGRNCNISHSGKLSNFFLHSPDVVSFNFT